MARDMNEFSFTGRIVADPETRSVGESSVTNWRVAIDNSYKGKDGQWVNKALFIDVSAWNGLGTAVASACKKGDFVWMRATLDEDTWEDKETGAKRKAFKFKLVNSFDWRKYNLVKAEKNSEAETKKKPATPVVEDDDSEIPF